MVENIENLENQNEHLQTNMWKESLAQSLESNINTAKTRYLNTGHGLNLHVRNLLISATLLLGFYVLYLGSTVLAGAFVDLAWNVSTPIIQLLRKF